MERSKKILFVSHCILNNNTRAEIDTGKYTHIVDEVVNLAKKHGIGLEQIPCPEFEKLGCPREGRTKTQYENLEGFREICSQIAEHVAEQIEKFQKAGYRIYGVVGIKRSPSCSSTDVYLGPNQKERRLVKGNGIFVEELKKRVNIPFIDWDHKDISGSLKNLEKSRLSCIW